MHTRVLACRCSHCGYFPEDFAHGVPAWDVVVMDEGHKVKNSNSKTYKVLHNLPSRMRVVVTGTPMQNNLMEMHALLDLACPGLLPDSRTFKKDATTIESGQVCLDTLVSPQIVFIDHPYSNFVFFGVHECTPPTAHCTLDMPHFACNIYSYSCIFMSLLTHSCLQDKNAPLVTKQQGHACAERLHALFDPYLLRRNKSSTRLKTVATARTQAASESCGPGAATGAAADPASSAAGSATPTLPGKTDLVVWLQMHPVQKQAYQVCLKHMHCAAACRMNLAGGVSKLHSNPKHLAAISQFCRGFLAPQRSKRPSTRLRLL